MVTSNILALGLGSVAAMCIFFPNAVSRGNSPYLAGMLTVVGSFILLRRAEKVPAVEAPKKKENNCEINEEAKELEEIQELYTDVATNPQKDFGWGHGKENAQEFGYSEELISLLPEKVWISDCSGGCPFTLGPIRTGDHVADLCCGAGADVCIAAKKVGPTGKVYGIDVTQSMLDATRKNVALCNLSNVELVHSNVKFPDVRDTGRIPENSLDVVISNNSINLLRKKLWCLVQARKLLKPGGRLQIVDVCRDAEAEKTSDYDIERDGTVHDWVTGTVVPEEMTRLMEKAGFENVEMVGWTGYRTSPITQSAMFRARKPLQ